MRELISIFASDYRNERFTASDFAVFGVAIPMALVILLFMVNG